MKNRSASTIIFLFWFFSVLFLPILLAPFVPAYVVFVGLGLGFLSLLIFLALLVSRATTRKRIGVEEGGWPIHVGGVRWAKAVEEAERRRTRERLEQHAKEAREILERHAKERMESLPLEQMVVERTVADQVVQIECEDCGVRYPEGTVKCPICNNSLNPSTA